MTIKVDIPNSPESLVYDHIFMDDIVISQKEQRVSILDPKYTVTINYRVYALDQSGNRHYDRNKKSVSSVDYLQDAKGKNSLGDSTMLDALVAIEKVISLLITDKGNIGNTRVVL